MRILGPATLHVLDFLSEVCVSLTRISASLVLARIQELRLFSPVVH